MFGLQKTPRAVGNMIGAGPPSDISQLSVSPSGPPKLLHKSSKEKIKRQTIIGCRKNTRQLLKHRAAKIAAHFKNGNAKQNVQMLTSGLPAGPFSVQPGTSLRDIALLRNLFIEGVPNDMKRR